jgi:hypothetical protein
MATISTRKACVALVFNHHSAKMDVEEAVCLWVLYRRMKRRRQSYRKHWVHPILRNRLTTILCFFFLVSLGGVRLSPLGTSATVGLLYQPRMIDDDYGAVGRMRVGRGNRSTQRKRAPAPLSLYVTLYPSLRNYETKRNQLLQNVN